MICENSGIRNEAGYTLIEMMVALALFGLIGVAGLTLVTSILDIHKRTQGRLERLADLQRAVFIIDADLTQIAPGPIVADGASMTFERHGMAGGADQAVGYTLVSGNLRRSIGARRQQLLTGVADVGLSYFETGAGWRQRWPPAPDKADAWPAAIAIDLTLASGSTGPGGTLRRVIALPSQP